VRARTVVIATGARYRRALPSASNLMAMEGRGVCTGFADRSEDVRRRGVVLVGGGNSAGQAAVYLSGHASKVWMLVRGPRASRQHVEVPDRPIAATPNIELLTRTEITHLTGSRQAGVESVGWRRAATRDPQRPIRHVFCSSRRFRAPDG